MTSYMNPAEWKYEPSTSTELEPGMYWFGDLCYILNSDVYDTIFGTLGRYESGTYTHTSGALFVVSGTSWGDGRYESTDGASYGVDAGVLSLVSVKLIESPPDLSKISVGEKLEYSLGTIFNFGDPIECCFKNGIFEVDSKNLSFVVDTQCGNYEEDEDEEDEDE